MINSTNATEESAESANSTQSMPAEFGLPTATFVVIAGMVGAGVLTTSGYTVALVGSNQWMLILWVLGGLTAVCGALTLAELSAALPRTGGDYVYLYEAYGPLPAFLSGWVSFFIGFAGPTAASAFAFAKYTLAPFHAPGDQIVPWERALATLAIVVFAAIHVSGRRRTASVQAWITILKLIGLGIFALSGLSIGWRNSANLSDLTPLDGKLSVTLMSSMVYIYYAYTGWNSASYLAGEVRDPQRRLPQAILLGTAGVTVLYLAINVVYALALSAADVRAIVNDPSNRQGLEGVANIAQLAAARLFGDQWSTAVSLGAGLMLLSTLSVYVLIGPARGVRHGRGRPVSGGGRPIDGADSDTRRGDRAPDHGRSRRALDGYARKHLRLCGSRSLDFFDAGDDFDLRPPPATPRAAAAIPHARVSRDSGRLSLPHSPSDRGHLSRSPQAFVLCSSEHLAGIPFYYIWQEDGPSLDALRRIPKLIEEGRQKANARLAYPSHFPPPVTS